MHALRNEREQGGRTQERIKWNVLFSKERPGSIVTAAIHVSMRVKETREEGGIACPRLCKSSTRSPAPARTNPVALDDCGNTNDE